MAARASWVDIRSRRVPDALVIWMVAAVAIAVAMSPGAVPGVLAGAAAAAAPVLAVHLLAPPAIGFGDVKFAAALGAGIGLVDWRLGPVAVALAAGATALVALARRRGVLPFAPGLWAGTVACIIVDAGGFRGR